jgi:hypothetical protein
MKVFLRSVSILSLLALASAPAFAIGPCTLSCTCSSSCIAKCVGPDGIPMTCGDYGRCTRICSQAYGATQLGGPTQEAGLGGFPWLQAGIGQGDLFRVLTEPLPSTCE